MRNDPNCQLCKLSQTAETVCMLGVGDKRADVMIIGEAPGRNEDEQGEPFVGRAGELLDDLLEEIGLDRDEVYICNAVSCRPPDNRKPSKREIAACKKWLDYQIQRVKPKYILTLGNTPLQALTGHAGIKSKRGKPIDQGDYILLPTYHPAFALRDPRQLFPIKTDFAKLKEIIEFGGIPEERELDFEVVDTQAKVERMLADLRGSVAVDLETTRLYAFTTVIDEKLAKGIANDQDKELHKKAHGHFNPPRVVSINFGTAKRQWVLPCETAGIWTREQLIDIIDRITEKLESCFVIGHNFKFDMVWMRERFGVEWHCDFDTMMAHYALDENDQHGLKGLAQKIFGAPDWEIDEKDKQTWSLKNAKYGAHDVFYTRKLRFHFGRLLHRDGEVKKVFNKILMPCVAMFADAEYWGIHVDVSKMDDAREFLRGELNAAKKKLSKWLPPHKKDLNWGSTKQLGELMTKDLKIKFKKEWLTKTGAPSTAETVLNQIDHPMVGDLIQFRGAKQQLSFFIDGWKPYLCANDRIHPSFKIHGTVTGRLSCEHPNLQQVPRDERIRTLVTAPEGWSLIEVDLSQIELRIAAELAGETSMLDAFARGIDVHWLTALREIERGGGLVDLVLETAKKLRPGANRDLDYGEAIEFLLEKGPDAAIAINKVWKEYRKKAKAINFGYLYGMWWKKFKLYARDNYGVEVTDAQAQASRKNFFALYPKFIPWHERQKRFARLNGWVRSLSGRKRRLPEAQDAYDSFYRQQAERQAINSPVQGFANELNLMACLQLFDEFPRAVMRVAGTVHDSGLFMVRNDHVERFYLRALEVYAHPKLMDEFEIELGVPLEGEAKIGAWGAGVKLEKWLKDRKEAA